MDYSDEEAYRLNQALDRAGQGDASTVPVLITAFLHDSRVVRLFHASAALVHLGAAAVPALTKALASPHGRVRIGAAITLFKIGGLGGDPETLLPIAVRCLEEDDLEARRDAILILGGLNADDLRPLVPMLLRHLDQPYHPHDPGAWSLDPRLPVIALLTKIGEPLGEIVTALAGALRHGDLPSLRWGAALGLCSLGEGAATAVPVLAEAVCDETEFESVRVDAAYALAMAGDPEKETLPALLQMLASWDAWVRVYAARILGEMGSPPAPPREAGPNGMDRFFFSPRALRRLKIVPSVQEVVVPALARAVGETDYNVRRSAVLALAEIGPNAAAAIPALVAALALSDTGPIAAEALAKIGEAPVLPALRDALRQPDETVRRHAAYALSRLDTPAAHDLVAATERERPVGPFVPSAAHFYSQCPVALTEPKVAAFEALFEEALSRGRGQTLNYALPYPKHEFLRYLVEHKGLLLHGSSRTDLDVLQPLRWSTDASDHGNVSGVYADRDWIRPIYFAVIHRDRCFGLDNGFFDLSPDGEVRLDQEEPSAHTDRRFWRLAISVDGLRRNPWRWGMIYILPAEPFTFWNEWTSRTPVRPLMRLAVDPEDLPLKDEVLGTDWRGPGAGLWADPRSDPFPFLTDARGTAIRPRGDLSQAEHRNSEP